VRRQEGRVIASNNTKSRPIFKRLLLIQVRRRGRMDNRDPLEGKKSSAPDKARESKQKGIKRRAIKTGAHQVDEDMSTTATQIS